MATAMALATATAKAMAIALGMVLTLALCSLLNASWTRACQPDGFGIALRPGRSVLGLADKQSPTIGSIVSTIVTLS